MAKSKTTESSPDGSVLSRLHKRINYGMAARLLVGAALVLLLAWAIQIGWQRLTHQPEFLVYPSTFQLDTPAWATEELAEELRHVDGLSKRYSIFEFGLTHRIASAYEKCPWVYRVLHIRREFPSTIHIKLMLRKPVAAVRVGREFHLADEEAVRLPREFYVWPHPAFDLPMLFHDRLREPLPDAGTRWRDRGVRAGVLLAKFLGDRRMLKKFKITTIDATQLTAPRSRSKGGLVLLTEHHTPILWGSSPLCNAPGERTDEQKLANLIAAGEAESYDFSKLEYVDVRYAKAVSKRRRMAMAR